MPTLIEARRWRRHMNDAFPQSVHEQAWEGICAELLATLPCDLEKAPSGPSAKIIEIGRLFACAATLATNHSNRIFFVRRSWVNLSTTNCDLIECGSKI
jgi:hypothetical protein